MPNSDIAKPDLDAQEFPAIRGWAIPKTEERESALLIIEVVGGPKTYYRTWLKAPVSSDWTWQLPEDAVPLWDTF